MNFVRVRIRLQLIRHVKQGQIEQHSKSRVNPSSYAQDITNGKWRRQPCVRIHKRPYVRIDEVGILFESIKVDSIIFVSIRASSVRIQCVKLTWSTSNRWGLSRFETIGFSLLRIHQNGLRSNPTLRTLQAFIHYESMQSIHFDYIT